MPDAQADRLKVVSARLATPEEEFFLDAYLRQPEASVARSSDALSRLVTLATALTGGAVVLLKEDVCYGWWRVVGAGCFFLALAAAVVGSLPVTQALVYDPRVVKSGLERVAGVKGRWAVGASALIMAGLLAVLVGAVITQAKR